MRQEWSGGRGNKDHRMVSAEGLLKGQKKTSLYTMTFVTCYWAKAVALTKKPLRINWQGTDKPTDRQTD